MAWSLPRLLRRLAPELLHVQHALPLGWRGRSVVTLHDLHFERHPDVMPLVDRLTFKTVVPRAARRTDHVIAVSERTKRDAIELYRLSPDEITVVPHGVDPAFGPGEIAGGERLRALRRRGAGARTRRRHSPPRTRSACRSSSSVRRKDEALARRLAAGGADVRGFVSQEELAVLYRSAEALVLPSR